MNAWNALNAIGGLFLVVLIVLALPVAAYAWEKRRVWPYGAPGPNLTATDPGGYGLRTTAHAIAMGYTFLGWCPDQKGKMYKIDYAALVSPDRRVLALVGVGTMLGIPMAGTWLHTIAANRQRSWATVDNPSAYERDLLGQGAMQIVRAPNFAELAQAHGRWVDQELVGSSLDLAPGRELKSLADLKRDRVDLMVRSGWAQYVDGNTEWWRYTLSGAVRVTLSSFKHQFRAMTVPKRR